MSDLAEAPAAAAPPKEPFGGIARLYGQTGLARLQAAHVAVVGLGGVGSWTVEALARSGVGRLTLVDADEVCPSNLNRQLPATTQTLGRGKADVLAERAAQINPAARVTVVPRFFNARTTERIFAPGCDAVVDAIDDLPNKARLLHEARQRGIFTVTSGAAGGKRDLTQIVVDDLVKAHHDPMLARLRKELRTRYDWPRETRKRWDLPAVFSPEPPTFPTGDGEVCANRAEASDDLALNCASGYGTASFVTGAIGFALAQAVVGRIAGLGR